MRALIIGPDVVSRIEAIKRHATDHRLDRDIIRRIAAREILSPGDDPSFVVYIPVGFRAVYTIEQHPHPDTGECRWYHHLSLSVATPNPEAVPHPVAIEAIMHLFGMDTPLDACHRYIEEGNYPLAANVGCPYKEPEA